MRACLALAVLCMMSAGCWSTYKSKPVALTGQTTVSTLDRHDLPTTTRNDLHTLDTPFRWASIWEVTAEGDTDGEPARHFAKYTAMPVNWEADLLLQFDLPSGSVLRPGYVSISSNDPDPATGTMLTVEIDLPDQGGFTLAVAKSRDEQVIPAIIQWERLNIMRGGRPPSASRGPLPETHANGHFSMVCRSNFMNKWRNNEAMVHLARRLETGSNTYVALVEWRRSQVPDGTYEGDIVDGCLTILNGIRAIEPVAQDALEAE